MSPRGIAAAQQDGGLIAIAALPDGERLASRRRGGLKRAEGIVGPDAGEDHVVGLRGAGGDLQTFGAQRIAQLIEPVARGRRQFAIGNHRHLPGGHGGQRQQDQGREADEFAHAHSVRPIERREESSAALLQRCYAEIIQPPSAARQVREQRARVPHISERE